MGLKIKKVETSTSITTYTFSFLENVIEIGRAVVKIKDEPLIESLWIEEPYRMRGVGSKALNILCEHFKERGYRKIVVDSLPGSYEFYGKNGFKIIDHEPCHVYMCKEL